MTAMTLAAAACGNSNLGPMDAAVSDGASNQPRVVEWGISIDNADGYLLLSDGESFAPTTKRLDVDKYRNRTDIIEVRHPDTNGLLDTIIVSSGCLKGFEAVAGEFHGLVVTPTGQIYEKDLVCVFPDGTSAVGENFGPVHCLDPSYNDCEDRCGLAVAHDAPSLLHIECAPAGTVEVGASCLIDANRPEGFDNCVSGTACVGGVCRSLCSADDPDSCSTNSAACSPIDQLDWAGAIGVCR